MKSHPTTETQKRRVLTEKNVKGDRFSLRILCASAPLW